MPPVAAKSFHVEPAPRTRAHQRGFVVGAVKQHPFPKSAKVRTGAEYRQVFEHARRTADPVLSLHWHAAAHPPRLGLAVSRKVDKRAVERNRIKRGLREQFRLLRPHLSDGDYVVVARTPASGQPLPELREAFARVLVRAGALPASALDVTMAGQPSPMASHSCSTSEPAAPAG